MKWFLALLLGLICVTQLDAMRLGGKKRRNKKIYYYADQDPESDEEKAVAIDNNKQLTLYEKIKDTVKNDYFASVGLSVSGAGVLLSYSTLFAQRCEKLFDLPAENICLNPDYMSPISPSCTAEMVVIGGIATYFAGLMIMQLSPKMRLKK
jgi:hypothetical protein